MDVPKGRRSPCLITSSNTLFPVATACCAKRTRSSGYGKNYLALDNVEKRMDSVADLAYAVKWLHSQPNIDARRIAIKGGSYGGFMVLSALTTYPDLWAAAVDIVGISNFVTFLENASPYRRSHREGEYGSLEHDREFLTRISPIHQVNKYYHASYGNSRGKRSARSTQ